MLQACQLSSFPEELPFILSHQVSPVSELSFPAVTICTAGMNLNAVKVALNIDLDLYLDLVLDLVGGPQPGQGTLGEEQGGGFQEREEGS